MGIQAKAVSSQSFRNLLPRNEVDPVYLEPYILTGYRHSGTSVYQCLQYTLVLHNEMGNFWTHFIPFLVWLAWFWVLATYWVDFSLPYHYPLLCFWAGSCSYALFSSMAHLFSCISFVVRTVCFLMDYLGIAMYALGGGMASLYYLSPSNSPCFSYITFILSIQVCLAVLATLLCGLSRFFWKDYRFFIRVGAYSLPYTCSIGPFLHRMYVCQFHGTDCVPETMFWHVLAIVFTIMLVLFFVTKIPERLIPGRCDIFFQSHQLFHLSTVALTSVQMHFMPMEVKLRRDMMSVVEGAMPSWQTTLLPFVCAEVLGAMVVGLLGFLTWKGFLTTNKYNMSKNE